MEPNPRLVLSSFSMLLPTGAYLATKEYVSAAITGGCFVFSVLHHGTKPMYPDALLADLVFANMCVLAATRTTLQWLPLSMSPYLAFLVYGAVVYHYGYSHSILAWDPDPSTATGWHASMHWVHSSLSAFSILMAGAVNGQ
jgi:hypothetical protein